MCIEFKINKVIFFSLLAALSFGPSYVFGQALTGGVSGKVVNENNEPLDYAMVKAFLNNRLVGGGYTSIDGIYSIKPLNTGTYRIEVEYHNYYKSEEVITIESSQYLKLNFRLKKINKYPGPIAVHIISNLEEHKIQNKAISSKSKGKLETTTILDICPVPHSYNYVDVKNPGKDFYTRQEMYELMLGQ